MSTSYDRMIGDIDYHVALKKLNPFILDTNGKTLLIKSLSLSELESLKD